MERILLHTCCAPCIIYPLEVLASANLETASFFYNPNIQPYQEYERRRGTLIDYCKEKKVELVEGDYDIDRFFQDVVFREKVRCAICYKLRLERTAKLARKERFDYFSTTLLVSPHQKHEVILDLGKFLEEKYRVNFFYRDFRVGFRKAVEVSKELGFYRQKYCGCVYSERERHHPAWKRREKK